MKSGVVEGERRESSAACCSYAVGCRLDANATTHHISQNHCSLSMIMFSGLFVKG